MSEQQRKLRPGPGWHYLGGAVWAHRNGARIHLGGLVRLPDMRYLSAHNWPTSADANRFIRINGGNRKRGLMAWALANNH